MAETVLTVDFARPMPVFPLGGCVLLPHIAAPLHIFEQRYRQMTREALDSNGLIAMAMFARDPDEDEYLHGRPALRPMTCLGVVAQYERLDDGRYLLLLQGVCRARLVEEVDHEPYRLARLVPVDIEPAADAPPLDRARETIVSLLSDPAIASMEPAADLLRIADADAPTEALIELVAAKMYDDAESMYRVLAMTTAAERAAWLIARLNRTRRAGGMA